MNFAISLLAAVVQVTPVAVAQPTAIRMPPPSDWSALPELRLAHRPPANPDLSTFVHGEVAAGRCVSVVRSSSGTMLTIDLAVLVDASGHVKRIVPRAIDCVTVEQYAAGLVSRQTRDNIDSSGMTNDTWFRTTMTFVWTG